MGRLVEGRSLVLLGAGASVEAGVPASFAMTEKLVEAIADNSWGDLAQALNFVCGALVAYDASAGHSPYRGLDVERVFAAIELLAQRRDLEVTPFVASWHPAVNQWDRPRLPSFFDRALLASLSGPGPHRGRDALVDLIKDVTGDGTGGTYRDLAERMVQELRNLVAIEPGRESYLSPLLEEARRRGSLTVATLNYDRAVEQLGERAGVPVETGIEEWVRSRRWAWGREGIQLLKLHGSIDWSWHDADVDPGEYRRLTIERVEDGLDDDRRPVLVFGQRGKLRAQGPFLSMVVEWDRLLAEADELVVVGYSFRDDHINEAIGNWAADDTRRAIRVIDPNVGARGTQRGFLGRLVSDLDPDPFSTNGEVYPQRVDLLSVPASEGLAEVFG